MRKRPKADLPREFLINVKLSWAEFQLVDKASKENGMTKGSFAAIAILKEASKKRRFDIDKDVYTHK